MTGGSSYDAIVQQAAQSIFGPLTHYGSAIAISAAIVGTAILLYFILMRLMRPIEADIATACDSLSRYEDATSLAVDFSRFSSEMLGNALMSEPWKEFCETLVEPSGKTRVLRNIHDSHTFFNEHSCLAARVNLHRWQAVPNYLTGFGILGTFLGLVAGIYMAHQGLTAGDPVAVNNALSHLLGGASLAFSTSIVGLATSIGFSWLMHGNLHSFRKRLIAWNALLDARMERITMEGLADQSLREAREQTVELKRFNTDLAVAIADALDDRLAQRLVPSLERVVASVDGLRSNQEDIGENAIRQMMSSFQESFSGSTGKAMESFGGTLQSMNECLNRTITEFSAGQDEMRRTHQALADEMNKSISNNADRLQEVISSTLSNMVSNVENVMSGIRQTLSESAAGVTTSISAAGASLEGAATEARENISQAASQIRDAASVFGGSVQALVDMNQNNSAYLDGLRSLIEELDAGAQEIRDSVQGLRSASQGNRDASDELRDTVEGIADIAEKLQAQAGQIGESVEITKEVWKEYQERFSNIDRSLSSVFQELNTGLAGYTDRVKQFHEQLDDHLGRALTQLGGVVQELGEVVEDFDGKYREA